MKYQKKGNNLILIAKGLGKDEAPSIKPENTDLWTLNNQFLDMSNKKDVDLLWVMHLLTIQPEEELQAIKLANSMGIPIMMPKQYPAFPMSIEFPLKEVVSEFSSDYFFTVLAYMLAYAIYLRYKKIDCYGLCMRAPSETYKNGKACVEYWTGIGHGRGIEINHHGKYSLIMKTFNRRIYGYTKGDLCRQM